MSTTVQLLTSKGLEQYMVGVSPSLRRRAQALCDANAATLAEVAPTSATVAVSDGAHRYRVTVLTIAGRITTLCDCAHTDDGPCLHRVAAVMTVSAHMQMHPPQQWEALFAVADKTSHKPMGMQQAHIRFFLRSGHPHGVGNDQWALFPANVILRTGSDDWEQAEVRPLRAPPTPAGHPDTALGVLQAAAMLCEQTLRTAQPAQRSWLYAGALALLHGVQVFLIDDEFTFRQPITVISEPGELRLSCDEDGTDLLLQSMVYTAHHTVLVNPQRRIVLPFAPNWLLTGQSLVGIGDSTPLVEQMLQTPLMRVVAADRERFDARLLELAGRVPLCGSGLRWDEVQSEPLGHIDIGETELGMSVTLRFDYAGALVAFDPQYPVETILHGGEELHLIRINRDIDGEMRIVSLLEQHGLRLGDDGHFRLRRRSDPVDFMVRVVGSLVTAGLVVAGEERLSLVRMRMATPAVQVVVASHIDWFDVAAVVHFDDLSVDLATIRRAVLRRERYIVLADGSLGLVPSSLAQRLAPLLAMGDEQDGHLRYAGAQAAVVDQLVQVATHAQTDAAFEERRARLRLFAHIEPQPLPVGFVGSLRSYQKAGYDWLHFLNTYGFGGCLADDMGVGKTIQTLVFVQSLRERTPGANAVLIVMPRSLIYNWEREAERFTPAMRVLVHADQGRQRSVSAFAGYDVVLTTYGTMLRDIDMLTQYRFQYAILDESQAIKNPNAETSRAVRRLQADRRLSLTGTPIENNVVELWSQFAFLNPGLLGSADTFRETFTRDDDGRDEALALLRKLTYPFILRRTKDQVAPDLPARTEHVVYSDMEPEQRRLYEAQRDHYRALLLGLIDTQGQQQARVKMLEGLLRLRQICNHPRLVDAQNPEVSGKFDALLSTMESIKLSGHRALVFSQFVQMLSLIRTELDARGIRYAYLDGRTRDRQQIIDAFQHDTQLTFFLISLRAGGVGLNLTAADYVIHVDPWWNPAVEMQATDRSHRIGQTKPVMVYKMVVRDSVEEKILQLQDRKRELVSQLITPEQGGVKHLTRDDVELLFT